MPPSHFHSQFASQPSSGRPANYYDILEVSRSASPEVIRAAYRSLMQRYHPDKNPGDGQAAERAALVVQAYETLSDATRRAAYDATLPDPAAPAMASASTASNQAWMESRHAHPYARTVPKKNYASLVLLLFVCVVVAAACWALIATVRHVVSPTLSAPAPASALSASPGQAGAAPRRRLRIAARPGVSPNAPGLSAAQSAEYDSVSSPQYDAPGAESVRDAEIPGEHGTTGDAMGRDVSALVSNLSIALRNPQNPGETTGYRLEIPAVAVRLGGKQTASARDHLGNMTTTIRNALETRLELADYDSLMMPDGEIGLARLILAAIAQATGLPVCASETQEAEACYGLVAVRLPEAYVVK